MKKLSIYALFAMVLFGCKSSAEQGYKTASIENFPEKVEALIQAQFNDNMISEWVFDGAFQKTGDNKTAEIILPKRSLRFTNPEEEPEEEIYTQFSFPENTIKATALEGDKVRLNSDIDFSENAMQLSEEFSQYFADEKANFKTSFTGKQQKEKIYNLSSQALIEASYKTMWPQFLFNLDMLSYTEDFFQIGMFFILKADEMQSHVKIHERKDKEDGQDIDFSFINKVKNQSLQRGYNLYMREILNFRMEQIDAIEDAKVNTDEALGFRIEQTDTVEDTEINLLWKGFNSRWLNLPQSLEALPSESSVLSTMQDALLNDDVDISYIGKGARTSYKMYFYDNLLTLLQENEDITEENKQKIIDFFNNMEDSFLEFAYNYDRNSNFKSFSQDEKANFFFDSNATFHRFENNLPIDELISIDGLADLYGKNNIALARDWYELIVSYAPKKININADLQNLKKPSLPLDLLRGENSSDEPLDIGGAKGNFHIFAETKRGFISFDAMMDITQETLSFDEISSHTQFFNMVVKIENFDHMFNPIIELMPQSQIFIKMFKGLGKADADNAAVTVFEISYDSDNQPKINGMAFPKF